ncbi:hypothetical protein LEMA_P099340.1 [Plenodomus lingam JN3]|uniref:F-box domain-containing protein n=2 Tax=Leptosphaeria maculans TaxID=5022 RepID=E4ZZU3_LEPMJ|nr:hypothetical protein LEMA_P099340.1 [Plenodomus lingam JN3]CBX96803.1 hypothetical protein LEMA_P099340.1 [Plenodomus lingam JN3]
MLYAHMGLDNFMNLALAIYPTLQRHGLVPNLTVNTLIRIINEWRTDGAVASTSSAASRVPVELWLQIVDYLEPSDTSALVFALGTSFFTFHHKLSSQTLIRLCIWSRKSREK